MIVNDVIDIVIRSTYAANTYASSSQFKYVIDKTKEQKTEGAAIQALVLGMAGIAEDLLIAESKIK